MAQTYTNRPRGGDFAINFFYKNSQGVRSAQLACPFFTDTQPVEILKGAGCEKVRLLVRLCEATKPDALEQVRRMDGVDVRFFTHRSFHAKFYILGDVALVGSSNLTKSGLTSNRELSITVTDEEPIFDNIPALFDELWNTASTLTDDALERFRKWFKAIKLPELPDIEGVQESKPKTVDVSTQVADPTRTYLETFRALYVERLIPAYRTVEQVYADQGAKHPVLGRYPRDYELDRFLFYVRDQVTDDQLEQQPYRSGDEQREFIASHIPGWMEQREEDIWIDEERISRIAKLKELFSEESNLDSVQMDELADMLTGVAAFNELLRFTKGGLPNLLKNFKADNSIGQVRSTFRNLVFGKGDYVQRVYDCVYLPEYKLQHWGRNCTWELFGWCNNQDVPPFNGRIMKALRYLGFDVPTH